MPRPSRLLAALAASLTLSALALTSCSSGAATSTTQPGTPAAQPTTAAGTPGETPAGQASGQVTLVTHDSFAVTPESLKAFEKASGVTVKQTAPGGAGEIVNQLVLTKANPLGDVVFGIDNTHLATVLDAGIIEPYTSPAAGPEQDQLAGPGKGTLTAVDYSDVCINVDHAYFAAKKLAEPKTLADLTKPEYKDLLVVTNPASSSPGMAFLLATISAEGDDGWQPYWKALVANGVKIAPSWTDAYYTDFSGSEGKGPRPLALSYSSSPPAEVPDGATSAPTGALLDTCYRQVEYAGVLKGAKNPAGAKAVVDWMLSPAFQSQLPDQMYVYPAVAGTKIPESWAKYAPAAAKPHQLDPQKIAANSREWLQQWNEIVTQ